MADRFLTRASCTEGATARMVCFPFAGGGTAPFHRWRPHLPRSIDLVSICLPARERRFGEVPVTRLVEVATSIAAELAPSLDRPWAAIGHSMGAWLAFEVIRELRRGGARQPELFVAAASRAPDVARLPSSASSTSSDRVAAPDFESPLYKLPDDEFLAAVRDRFDGIPAQVRENAELLRLLLPALRGDMQMVETYSYVEGPPLDVEILALGGRDDPAVSTAQLADWRRHTHGRFTSRFFPGGHFFLFRETESFGDPPGDENTRGERPSPPLQTIIEKLQRLRQPSAGSESM